AQQQIAIKAHNDNSPLDDVLASWLVVDGISQRGRAALTSSSSVVTRHTVAIQQVLPTSSQKSRCISCRRVDFCQRDVRLVDETQTSREGRGCETQTQHLDDISGGRCIKTIQYCV
ncbi:hypothetical protein ACI65C_006283, partial [Semiaphis heraclei]